MSFLATAFADGAPDEQVLGAVDLGRLRQHAGAAVAHQLVHRPAERGVGGDAGVAVGAAAIGRQRDLGDRLLRPPGGVRHGQELGDLGRGLLDGLLDAAGLLDVDDHRLALGMPGRRHALLVHHDGGLVDLAAEADQDVGGDVGVLGVARQDALERHVVLAEELGAAARLVRDGEDAVDVRVVLRHVAELVLDELADAGRAVDAGDDGDVVARADAPVLALVAVEVAHLVGRVEVHGPHVGADLVLAVEVAHRQVLRVDVVAHGDVGRREADHLPVAAHLFALCAARAAPPCAPGGCPASASTSRPLPPSCELLSAATGISLSFARLATSLLRPIEGAYDGSTIRFEVRRRRCAHRASLLCGLRVCRLNLHGVVRRRRVVAQEPDLERSRPPRTNKEQCHATERTETSRSAQVPDPPPQTWSNVPRRRQPGVGIAGMVARGSRLRRAVRGGEQHVRPGPGHLRQDQALG